MKEVMLFNEIQLLDYEMILIKFKKIINKEIRKWSSIYEYEDLYQLALLGLYKAYTVYTLPYEFYGVAYKYIKWEIGSFHKKMSKHKAISLESAIFTDKNGEEISIEDKLGEEDKDIEEYADRELKRKILNKLSERQLDEISWILFKHKKQSELADKYGTNQCLFSRRAEQTLNRVRLLYLKELREI